MERFLPAQAEAAVVVPDLHKLGAKLTALQNLKLFAFAAQLQGLASGADYASALFSQVGLDPRSRESLERAGVDGARGLGFALVKGNDRAGYSVIAVSDEGKFKGYLATLARNRLGAGVEGTQAVGGVTLTVFSSAAGAPAALGYLVKDGYALVAPAEAFTALAAGAALPKGSALADDPAYTASLAQLPAARDLLIYLPGGSQLLPDSALRAAALGVEATTQALTFSAYAPLAQSDAAVLLQPQKGAPLEGLLPRDAFLLARYNGDPALLQYVWPRLVGPYVRKAFEESGFDVKGELLDNLQPGLVAALAVSPNVNLGAGMPELDVRRTNPFRYVNLVALAQAKDGAKASATLAKLPPVASRFGATLTAREKPNATLFETTYSQGEGAHLAASGGKVILASPMARMDETLAAVATAPKEAPLPKELLAPLEDSGLAVVVDLHKLAGAVRELPSSAWGVGGFAIKASTLRWLEGVQDLRALSVSARAKGGGISGEVRLRFAAP